MTQTNYSTAQSPTSPDLSTLKSDDSGLPNQPVSSVENLPLSHQLPSDLDAILTFWFCGVDGQVASYAERRAFWFNKSSATDEMIRQRFSRCYEEIVAGNYKPWQSTPEGCLALVIALDQFSRNMFRGHPKAFSTDQQALAITQRAIAQSFDQELLPVQRLFLYLPLEHSERRDHQQQAVALFQALADEHQELSDVHAYALKHQAVIERFGRFPHRNDILGRTNTPEEIEFLKQPGSSF
ncbi:MAG: DUF924 domain-containing protein [Merismopedia sp. SIO2A8]|nr:DUF924 domain-containing protein [Symploca sp. SIO2B6]NET47990.1 DUF924 domain-containing protein [Merismopedia sp. SIO2A8]